MYSRVDVHPNQYFLYKQDIGMFISFSYKDGPFQTTSNTRSKERPRLLPVSTDVIYNKHGPKNALPITGMPNQTIVPSIAFTGLFSEMSSRRSSSSYTAQISANFRLHTYIWEGCDFSKFNMLFIHGPLALFCLFSSSCDASFNMSVASLCMSSLDRATACM